jgi:large subunit ribosomal protein L25
MTMIKIEAKKRDSKDSLNFIRKNGLIPAVVYGNKQESTPITVDLRNFEKVFKQAGESSTITLSLDSKVFETLVHDISFDPISGKASHVDFMVVDTNKPITVGVPLEFVGVAPAVKGGLGTLVKVMHEIEVSALPKDLPHQIEVDISSLENIDSQLTAGELKLPKGVSLATKDSEIVVAISVQKEEVEETTPIDLSKIEVEKKGKKEEEVPAE